jgi:hypothetical protein
MDFYAQGFRPFISWILLRFASAAYSFLAKQSSGGCSRVKTNSISINSFISYYIGVIEYLIFVFLGSLALHLSGASMMPSIQCADSNNYFSHIMFLANFKILLDMPWEWSMEGCGKPGWDILSGRREFLEMNTWNIRAWSRSIDG